MAETTITEGRSFLEPPDLTDRRLRAWVFGHYDSRGGASITFNPNGWEAFREYASSFYWSGEGEDRADGALGFRVAYEDCLGDREVLLIGGKIDDLEGELLEGYRGDGTGYIACYAEWLGREGWHTRSDVIVLLHRDHVKWTTEQPEWEGAEAYEVPAEIQLEWTHGPPTFPEGTSDEIKRRSQTQYRLRHWDIGEDMFGLVVF